MRRAVAWVAGLALAGGAAGAAQAHSPYLLPNAFDLGDRDHVTVEASFTERFFTSDIVMKSDDFHAVAPDGSRVPLTPVYLRDLAVLEVPTAQKGTFRITTGARIGRTAKAALVKGEWVFLQEGHAAPAGATAVDMQSITRAEVYVTRGAPSAGALAPTGSGLEFHALTHPDEINAGEAARFEVLLDGKPVANQAIELHAADEAHHDKPPPPVVSDAQGRFALRAAEPGVYLAMTRYRLPPPASGGPAKSLTYALTFEAGR